MYYPKSQIKPNQYTNTGEFLIASSNSEYIGYYYSTSDGKFYSGGNPGDGKNQLLIKATSPPPSSPFKDSIFKQDFDLGTLKPNTQVTVYWDSSENESDADSQVSVEEQYTENSDYPEYSNVFSTRVREIPPSGTTTITDEDINKGYYFRYFCKDCINYSYFEVTKDTWNKMNNSPESFAMDIFEVTKLRFLISGRKAKLKNQTTVKIQEKRGWKGFASSFNFPIGRNEYLYTEGNEFVYLDRTNYVGYYYQTSPLSNIFFAGKYPGELKEKIPLISLNQTTQPPSESETFGY